MQSKEWRNIFVTDTIDARQLEEDLICPVSSSGPCGYMVPVRGTNPPVIMSMGRPQRCSFIGDNPLTYDDCKGMCEQWNRNPPPNHVGPPCAGIDFLESTACELVRSLRPGGETDLLCPQFRSDFELSSTNNWKAVTNASQICRFRSDSDHNPNLPDFSSFAVFDRAIVGDSCPGISYCPTSA